MDFDKKFPGTKTIMMMENYRSTPQILAAANSLIAKNTKRIPKELLPMLPDGGPVVCHFADRQDAEAKWISEEIKRLHEVGVPYSEITLLYRAHYVTRAIEQVFLQEKIPYTIYSGVQFYDRMEIKDALCYLRMIVYRDDLSFRRIVNAPGNDAWNFYRIMPNSTAVRCIRHCRQHWRILYLKVRRPGSL